MYIRCGLIMDGKHRMLVINEDYTLPTCIKHKIRTQVAISTSKRYPRTVSAYCFKCAEDF